MPQPIGAPWSPARPTRRRARRTSLGALGLSLALAAVTVSDRQSTLDFFPLLVEYKERSYAAGKIPGGYIKREGRPSDGEILSARIIDRTIRPLFPEGFKNEVQVVCTVLAHDLENDPDIVALVAGSAACAFWKYAAAPSRSLFSSATSPRFTSARDASGRFARRSAA